MTLFPATPPAGSAVTSPCGRYRYLAVREFGGPGPVISIGLVNPSTADGEQNDATMRRMVGFARRMDASRLLVWNKFAWRDRDVRALRGVGDPIGPENDRYIEQALRESEIRVVAWGPLAKLPARLHGRWREACAIADRIGAELQCWGRAGDGHPLHPLMLPYELPLKLWERPL
ncbi:MAG: DUF1643 domain-containing protein [Bosea sp.]|uniref:DUF1643 domain-containing protein n=1 Tax=unclassified Bosea (in: a-proteobacteria) TaxID=2653178 RepID=UPI000959364E|nr:MULTISPECIES: DUF1643 domain-containing protein [unclassified Bosea (in: a-proteobacteria)]MBN9459007.1 DUF1643 domain-containing protein [Bosea sp. (in: a-proteobacteria)]OJV06250.1 MAG: hypothetical protein BGO20_08310 [Bosea sp. 67-29]